MNLSNANDDDNNNADTTNTTTTLSSSPPTTPPATTELVDSTAQLDESAVGSSSSPDRRADSDEQPVIISPEYLPNVISHVELLGPRRVKVYELRGEVWADLGTGFCEGLVDSVCAFLWKHGTLLTNCIEHRVSKSHQ